MEIIINDYYRKNYYKKLKKYKDNLDVFLKTNSKDFQEKAFIKAYNEKDHKKRYNYIYEYMCNYINKKICKLCDFKDNKCIANRMKLSVHSENGCCHFRKESPCKLLKDKKCTIKCISCKLFMCEYIEKRILKYKSLPKNYLLLNFFFNKKQQQILQHNYRKDKKEIIEKLLELV